MEGRERLHDRLDDAPALPGLVGPEFSPITRASGSVALGRASFKSDEQHDLSVADRS